MSFRFVRLEGALFFYPDWKSLKDHFPWKCVGSMLGKVLVVR